MGRSRRGFSTGGTNTNLVGSRDVMARFELSPTKPAKRARHAEPVFFCEVELRETTLTSCAGVLGDLPRIKKKTFANEDDAQHAHGRFVRRYRIQGYVEVGPCQILPTDTPSRPAGSALLIDEYLAAADPTLFDEVLHFHDLTKLGSIAERWYGDQRPALRQMLLAYVDDGCARRHHKSLVKRLFKLAEAAQDNECMMHFMVAFDRLSRRTLGPRGGHYASGAWVPVVGLRADRSELGRLPPGPNGRPLDAPHFTRVTRCYLRRRVFRYFRRLGHRDPARYLAVMQSAFLLYRDEHLNTPAKLLDAWSLMHALYGYSDVLTKRPRGLTLAKDRKLADLSPAPYFPDAWKDAFENLVSILVRAQSRTIRTWALAMLRTHHPAQLETLDWKYVRAMLLSRDSDLSALGAELLPKAGAASSLHVGDWLELLQQEDLDVLEVLCTEMRKQVTPDRLDLSACIALACAQAAPVATLGLAWAKTKRVTTREDIGTVLALKDARVTSVRREGCAWLASLLAETTHPCGPYVRDLCDASFADARSQGLLVLEQNERYRVDLTLWFALAESPYEDVRALVLREATRWQGSARPETLQHLWATSLLAVHRGGTSKRRVPVAIAGRIELHPEEADKLLPLLGISLRSVRVPERTAALGALARAVVRDPSLQALVQALVPEISFSGAVSS